MPTARRKADEIIRLKEEGVRPSEIASRLGIGRASVYRVLGEQAGQRSVGSLMERLPEKCLEWQAGAWKFGMKEIRNIPYLLTTKPPGF